MRKILIAGIVAICLVLGPVVVFGGGAAEEDEVREITMWFGREDFIPDDAFETFHERHPDIRVDFDVIPLEEGLTEFIPAHREGRAPDVLQLNHHNMLPLIAQGMLQDISDEVIARWEEEDPDDFAQVSPFAFELATWEGNTYGMSFWGGPRFHVYRADVFAEHGLDAPETWEDVLNAAIETRADDMLGMSIHGSRAHSPWGWFGSKFKNMGGEFVDGVMQLDSEAGIYLLELHQAFVREQVVDPDVLALTSGDFRAAFIDGRAAQFYEAANLYPDVQAQMEYGEEWAAIPPPYRPGAEDEWTIAGFGWPHYVNSETEDLDAIYKIFRYLSEFSGEVAIRYQPPTRTTFFDDPEFLDAQPWWDDIKGVYDEMTMFPIHERMPEMQEVVNDAKQWALDNPDGDAAEAAARYQQELDAIHDQ